MPASKGRFIPARLVVTVIIALLAAGCGIGREPSTDPGPARPLADFKGMFAGDAISDDGRRVNIALDIQETGDQLGGTYRCTAGNANCRNQITRGWVMGSVDARSFRVSLQDGSWCMFTLGTFYLNEGEGEYTCYMGGSIVEQGTFGLKRVAPQ
jgi:hypothetical protein